MEDRIRGSLTRKELPVNPGNYGTTIPNEPETVRQFHAGGSLHDKIHDNPGGFTRKEKSVLAQCYLGRS